MQIKYISPTGRLIIDEFSSFDKKNMAPPSVEILFLRHSKARYTHLSRVVSEEQAEWARVNLVANEAKRWARR